MKKCNGPRPLLSLLLQHGAKVCMTLQTIILGRNCIGGEPKASLLQKKLLCTLASFIDIIMHEYYRREKVAVKLTSQSSSKSKAAADTLSAKLGQKMTG